MARTYLEFNTVHHHFETMSYENVMQELEKKGAMAERTLLERYPESFPKLYDIRQNTPEDEKISFQMREVELERPEIVTEAKDVQDNPKHLELLCTTEEGLSFGLMVEPYDKPGEDKPQLSARLNFDQENIEKLDDERFKRILEFCERHGISPYSVNMPEAGSDFSLDGKLAELAKKFLENRHREDLENPAVQTNLEANTQNIDLPERAKAKPQKKEKTLQDIYQAMIKFLENDIHKTAGLTYFEHLKEGMVEFSLYDKPNKDNEKLDGLKDKNGIYVPTYAYRLYIGQNAKNGNFQFGYATPGGKKMDDVMAGDFMGIVKESGATHLDFSHIPNQDKGLWLIACAEKGIVPIGISLNIAKMNMMKEKARAKLDPEEFITYEMRLAAQYRENMRAKGKGLQPSEEGMLESLEAAYNFENFRKGYDTIYPKIIQKIDEGSKNFETGAATTVGAQRALRTLFSIYESYTTLGDFVAAHPEYKKVFGDISPNVSVKNITDRQWAKMYDALLPLHVEKAEDEIVKALKREENRAPRRSSIIVINDVLNNVKGSLNEINIYLRRNGVEQLVLPVDHKNPSFDAYKFTSADAPKKEPTQNHLASGRDGR